MIAVILRRLVQSPFAASFRQGFVERDLEEPTFEFFGRSDRLFLQRPCERSLRCVLRGMDVFRHTDKESPQLGADRLEDAR